MSASYPPSGGGGGGISKYPSFSNFPATATDGTLALALDTDILYAYNVGDAAWLEIAGPGAALSVGTFDSGTASANGAHIDADALIMQSASATRPGLVNISTQTLAGVKTFSSAPNLSSLTASKPLQLDASKNVTAANTDLTSQVSGILPAANGGTGVGSLGNLTDAGTDGIVVTGGSGCLVTSASLAQHVADTSHNGYLSSTDWNTFNNKQPTITTGNLTDAGTDGIIVTNGSGAVIGTGTSLAQHVADTTHNGYLASTDWNTFNGKQAAGSYITALTGDVTATGPGSSAASLVATANATITTLSGLTTAASLATVGTVTSGTWNATTIAINHGGTGVTSVTTAPAATAFAGWDSSKNLSANAFIPGFTTTATAAGTTTLTVASTQLQYFTGSTTQTVTMPVTSTLVTGMAYTIVNNSTGVVTVQSSGANTIIAMSANTVAVVTCILTSGTTASSWNYQYTAQNASIASPDSMVSVDTGNGYGSTNTRIRRFTNSSVVGSGITYADSATLGGTFTINKAGVYGVYYGDRASATGAVWGVSLNGTVGTDIDSLPASQRMAIVTDSISASPLSCSTTFRCAINDVIRAHTDVGSQPTNTNAQTQFIVTQLASF